MVSTFLIPYIKSKLNASDREKLQALVKTAVFAAEQIAELDDGGKKKAYVIEFLSRHGYMVDTTDLADELNAAIEAAAFELNRQ